MKLKLPWRYLVAAEQHLVCRRSEGRSGGGRSGRTERRATSSDTQAISDTRRPAHGRSYTAYRDERDNTIARPAPNIDDPPHHNVNEGNKQYPTPLKRIHTVDY